jgi:hypothetical protein
MVELRDNEIRDAFINSKEFVNIFLGFTIEKTDSDRQALFNKVVDDITKTIVNS